MNTSTDSIEKTPLSLRLQEYINKHDLFKILITGFIFGLVVLLIHGYQIENRAFVVVLALSCIGFPIHHILPFRFKLPFFVLISFTAITLTVGFINAVWLIALGSVFIVLAHIPVPFWIRVSTQVGLGIILIVFRANLFPSLVPSAIWPILGSMFIFRLMIYMYDLRANTATFGVWRALAYFFMIPNVNFTLLPVIDYKNLFSVYYPKQKQAIEIYQKGNVLLIKGFIHLLLYRLVYQNLLIDPTTILGATDAAQYMIATFLLYLRISGYFHMISGILHMYGFNLPETHHLYFLASSFTDFWRRINIFWKDFMQKMFFYPVHFWLSKRVGPYTSITIATVYAFLVTYILHAYQWFWIRGDFKFSIQDVLFWGSLGVVVLINLLIEMKFPKKKSLKGPIRTWKSELILAIKTILTFSSIVFIWNVWSIPSLEELGLILSAFTNFNIYDFMKISLFFVCLGGLSILYGHKTRGDSSLFSFGNKKKSKPKKSQFFKSAAIHCIVAILFIYINKFPTHIPGSPALTSVMSRMMTNKLNEQDRKLLQRGYYEDLTDVARFNPELQALYRNKPADWNTNTFIVPSPDEYPTYSQAPSTTNSYKHQTVTINQWGGRDKEYNKIKPDNTYRAAISGASHTFGSGVGDGDTYESIMEIEINNSMKNDDLGSFELINFAVGGFGPASKIAMFEHKAQKLNLDGMVYVAIDDFYWALSELTRVLTGETKPTYPHQPIREIAKLAGVTADMSRKEAEIRLKKHLPEIVEWYYNYLIKLSEANNAELWFVFIPVPENQTKVRLAIEQQMAIARKLGIKVIDVTDTYAKIDIATIWVADWDKHPTVEGHQMLADKIYKQFYPQLIQSINNHQNK